jgi:hypothetical protein
LASRPIARLPQKGQSAHGAANPRIALGFTNGYLKFKRRFEI